MCLVVVPMWLLKVEKKQMEEEAKWMEEEANWLEAERLKREEVVERWDYSSSQ